ncbi:MAG: CSLREA domain-containing protein [Acidobacteriota bacterium]
MREQGTLPSGSSILPRLLAAGLFLAAASAGAATITVNSTSDATANDGVCTLREAITAANTNTASGAAAGECAAGSAGLDTITFNIPGAGLHTINPTSTFPTITEAVFIDAYTQPGASANTLAVGNNAVLQIEINGSGLLPVGVTAFQFLGGSGSTVRGLVVNRVVGASFDIGVSVASDSNVIAGNFIGSDATGSIFLGTTNTVLSISGGSSNTIGGTTPAARNVIVGGGGGNAATLLLQFGGSNLVAGNYIGVNAAGTAALQPATATTAIAMGQFSNNTIGGTTPAARNVLLGTNVGININNGANNNLFQGNFIGTNATGTAGLGGGNGITSANGAAANVIGGSAPGAGNLISGGASGIFLFDIGPGWVIQGNRIGTDVTGTTAIANSQCGIGTFFPTPGTTGTIGGTGLGEGNRIAFNGTNGVSIGAGTWSVLGNSIASNGGLGIAFTSRCDILATPTPNDTGDPDTGPNNLQNYPVITSAAVSAGNATISGTLNSAANTTFRIEFFSNAACDPSGNGEGQTFIGFTNATTNGSGNASFGPLVFPVLAGQSVITSTATDPANNTSEFSSCLGVVVPTATPTATATATAPGPTATPTRTPTAGAAPTATPTAPGGPNAAVVPTLSGWMLAFLGLALAAGGFALMRRL